MSAKLSLVSLFFVSSLCQAGAANFGAEQTADLYAKVFVNQDMASADQLNASLGAYFDGVDHLSSQAIRQMQQELPLQMVKQISAGLPTADQAALEPAIQNLVSQLWLSLQRSQCRTLVVKRRPKAITNDSRDRELSYYCRISPVRFDRHQLLSQAQRSGQFNRQRYQQLLTEQSAAFSRRKISQSVSGKIQLTATDNSGQHWYSHTPDAALQSILARLYAK